MVVGSTPIGGCRRVRCGSRVMGGSLRSFGVGVLRVVRVRLEAPRVVAGLRA